MAITQAQPPAKLTSAEANELAKKTPKSAGIGSFSTYLKHNMASIKAVAAKHMDPDRLFRMVLMSVSKTPALMECSMISIMRAAVAAAELGLDPGSAIGDAYLVPFKGECQLIPGYRGLIKLAFRSGHVKSVRANIVYQGDRFKYEDGLHVVLEHVPNYDGSRDVKDITFVYCIVHLKDGGLLYDVMTRSDVDRIRAMSPGQKSPSWSNHYGEMARKTVVRRCLKYAPMSTEFSKAIALDEFHETGDTSLLAEFESLSVEPEEEVRPSKTDRMKDKIGDVPETLDSLIETHGLDADQSAELKAKVEDLQAFLSEAAEAGDLGFMKLLQRANAAKEGLGL